METLQTINEGDTIPMAGSQPQIITWAHQLEERYINIHKSVADKLSVKREIFPPGSVYVNRHGKPTKVNPGMKAIVLSFESTRQALEFFAKRDQAQKEANKPKQKRFWFL